MKDKNKINKTSWKQIPTSLKFVFVLSIIWIIGTFFAIPIKFQQGLPFFGMYLFGISVIPIMLFLDIIGPIIFLIGTLKRKLWAVKIATIYILIFVLNTIVALFTVREQFGIIPLSIPAIVYTVFLYIIIKNKNYYK